MRRKIFKTRFLVSSAILCFGGGVPAVAQDEEQATDNERDTIVVTARFREVGIQDTGGSIAALGEGDLIQKGINTTADLARAVPSLNIQERGPNRNEFNIRGVTNFLVTQDILPSARPVGIYVDDAPVNTLGGAQIDVRTFDIGRIEVLRGPQGTLFGEGSSAGAIRYFTTDPDLSEFGGRIEADGVIMQKGGQTGGARGALNVPLIEDKVGVRLTGGRYAMPGYLNVVGGDNNVNDFSAVNFRGVFLAKPTDQLTFRVSGTWENSTVGSLGQATGDPDDFSTTLPLNDEKINDDYYLVTGKAAYDFGPFTATSITSYLDRTRTRDTHDQIFTVSNSLISVPTFGFVDATRVQDSISFKQFSQEIRLVSEFEGPFQLTAGAFYRDFEFQTFSGSNQAASYTLLGLPSNDTSEIFDLLDLPNPEVALINEGRQISGFVEGELTLFDRLRLIAGFRSHNETIDAASPPSTLISGAPFVLPAVAEEVSVNTILPTASIEYDLTEDILLYARYATGVRNGNINATSTLGFIELFVPGGSAGLESYGEDRTRTIEGGFKSTLFDSRVTFNATGFYTDYDDLQVVVATPPLGFGILLNASDASSIGFELEGTAQVTENLSTFLGMNYASAKLGSDLETNQITGDILPAGTVLPNTPDWTLNAGGEYTQQLPWAGLEAYLGGSVSYTSEYVSALSADEPVLGDFAVGNIGVGVRGQDWSFDLFISNVTNNGEIVSQNTFNDTFVNATGLMVPPGATFDEIFLLPPRTVRVTLRKSF